MFPSADGFDAHFFSSPRMSNTVIDNDYDKD